MSNYFTLQYFTTEEKFSDNMLAAASYEVDTTINDTLLSQRYGEHLRLEASLTKESISLTINDFSVYGFEGRMIATAPEIGFEFSALDRYNFNKIDEYFDEFDGLRLELSNEDDVTDGTAYFQQLQFPAVVSGILAGVTGGSQATASAAMLSLIWKSVQVDGGEGQDSFELNLSRDEVGIELSDAGNVLTSWGLVSRSGKQVQASLENFEKLALADGALLLDIAGDQADYTYALYRAALTRTPAEDGFVFWNDVMNSGEYGTGAEAELRLAREFVEAPEFTERFDVSTDEAFIGSLYENVLGRAPAQEGLDFWTDVFAQPDQGREDMLQYFALSDENQALIAEDVEIGYWVV